MRKIFLSIALSALFAACNSPVSDGTPANGSAIKSTQQVSSSGIRTVIYIYKETRPGQRIFIRGGHDKGLVPSSYPSMDESIVEYCNMINPENRTLKQNDRTLDWHSNSSLDWTADKWPAEWNGKKTYAVDGFGEDPENTFGRHFWKFDVIMDGTKGDRFEFKALLLEDGKTEPVWENNISQLNTPHKTINHWAKKGYINTVWFGENRIEEKEIVTEEDDDDFEWRNAFMYKIVIDRFANGDLSNDNSYGRETDASGNPLPGFKDKKGTFHGGDLKGLKTKVEDGYFSNLGVTVLYITAIHEQIHGWIAAASGGKYYPFHGYWPFDFTEVDRNYGSYDDLVAFVDAAHARGIRIVMEANMNQPGDITINDMHEYNFGSLRAGWQEYIANTPDHLITPAGYESYINMGPETESSWSNWWGRQWVRYSKNRIPLPGYTGFGNDYYTEGVYGQPDFITESRNAAVIPPILKKKWDSAKMQKEEAELAAFCSEYRLNPTARNFMIKWLTDWVEKTGIDGFRSVSATAVEMEAWTIIKNTAVNRHNKWKTANPDKVIDKTPFWLLGYWIMDDGIIPANGYNFGFDADLNFRFYQDQRLFRAVDNYSEIESLYTEYAANPSINRVNFISWKDYQLFFVQNLPIYNYPRYSIERLKRAQTILLLTPGAAQFLYGDENARREAAWSQWEYFSDMIFPGNTEVYEHASKLGQFRRNHKAVGAGSHVMIKASQYTFARMKGTDRIVCVTGASGSTLVPVSAAFTDGTTLRDAYTGQTAVVANGSVRFSAHTNGVILIEKAE